MNATYTPRNAGKWRPALDYVLPDEPVQGAGEIPKGSGNVWGLVAFLGAMALSGLIFAVLCFGARMLLNAAGGQ